MEKLGVSCPHCNQWNRAPDTTAIVNIFCWNCGQLIPCQLFIYQETQTDDTKYYFWDDSITDEPCPHCGKMRSEKGGGV